MGHKDYDKYIMVTGGAGFIGSNYLLKMVKKYPNYLFINVDKLSYAANISNLDRIKDAPNYLFERCDIVDSKGVQQLFAKYPITHILHFAAESHVDRSIDNPLLFVQNNVVGTVNLLDHAYKSWSHDFSGKCFYHISTDEVYGSLHIDDPAFTEQTPYSPHSPYSASKASADHFVRAYHDTFGLPILLSNCSNNYGPYQFPEKLIPLFILNILSRKPLPVYGDGSQIRDWLYVEDHVDAIDCILHKGAIGNTYNIGGNNEIKNIDLVKTLIREVDKATGHPLGTSNDLITYVKDRPGHDTRYAIDCTKIRSELGWTPRFSPEEGLRHTIDWYLSHRQWLEDIASERLKEYYTKMYDNR